MFTIGTDSEHGLYRNGNLVSAIGLIPGTKKDPYPLYSGGGLQVDNVLLEWNSPIAHSAEEFDFGIERTLADIKMFIPNMELGFESSYLFPMDQLMNDAAWMIGCEPDFNAWKMNGKRINWVKSKNSKPGFEGSNLRTAAAHIHVSPFDNPHDMAKFVKLQDLHLGLPSLFHDMDRIRRTLYGTAGSCRVKQYPNGAHGVEYRVLGSFWIKNTYYRNWVFNTSKYLYDNLNNLTVPEANIQGIINNYDLPAAKVMMDRYGISP